MDFECETFVGYNLAVMKITVIEYILKLQRDRIRWVGRDL